MDESTDLNPPAPANVFCNVKGGDCDACGKLSPAPIVEFTMEWPGIVGNAEFPPTIVLCSACLGDGAIAIHEAILRAQAAPRITLA